MANYANLKAAIQAVIKTNGNEEITGAVMQSSLLSMIDSLAAGYLFAGVATPSTNPCSPDDNVFYIGGAGTYANFGTSFVVPDGSIGVFKYNGTWTNSAIPLTETIKARLLNNYFLGKGNTFSESAHIVGLKSGYKYRFVLQNPDYERNGVTISNGVLFRISSYYNGVETILANVSKLMSVVSDYYDVVIPQNSDYIVVGGRANNEIEVRFIISDITYANYLAEKLDGKIDDLSDDLNEKINVLANKEIYKCGVDLSAYVGRAIAADNIKIPLAAKKGSIVRFEYVSNAIYTLKRMYVKYIGQDELTILFEDLGANYVTHDNKLQFIAEYDVDYITFLSTDYEIDANTNLMFYFETESLIFKDNILYESDYMWDIYESMTNNILDVENVVNGISIDNETKVISYNKRGVISRPVYVEEHQVETITISGYSIAAKRAVYFLNKPELLTSNIVDFFNLTGTQRTITIPRGSKYMIVCLRNKDYDSYQGELVDYSNIKVAYGSVQTSDIYSGKYLFNAISFGSIGYRSTNNNILDTSRVFSDLRLTDDPPYFVSGAYGILTCDATYIKGVSGLTFRNASVSGAKKWIVFTTDRTRTQNSVVGISFIPVNRTGEEQVVTVKVPENAVWVYVTMRVGNENEQTAKNLSCAIGSYPTNEIFEKGIGEIYNISLAKPYDESGEYGEVLKDERLSVWKRYLPYSVGLSPNTIYNSQYQRAHIIMFTDSHIDLLKPAPSTENVKDLVKFVNGSKINIDLVINAGDAITPFGRKDKSVATKLLQEFFNICKNLKCPFVFSKGNHDSNDWDNTPSNTLGDDDWSSVIYDYLESQFGFVRQTKSSGKKSSYGYYDITDHKIRVIVVDAEDIDHTPTDSNGNCKYSGANSFHVSNEQFQWIANSALSFNEDGWGVLVVIHQTFNQNGVWYTVEDMPSSIQKLFNMFVAFNNHTTYSNQAYEYVADSFYNLSALTKDFTFGSLTEKPKVICFVIGHNHYDKYVNVDGINCIWTLNSSAIVTDSDSHVARVVGTNTQNAFDLLSIDTKEKKIWYVRYGAGKNCNGEGGDRFLPEGLGY